MKKEHYNKIYKDVVKIIGEKKMLSYESIEEGLKELKEKNYIDKDKYYDAEEISELFALRWGILALILSNYKEDDELREYKIVYSAFLTNIANSCVAIIELSKLGFSFHANVLMRNLCELCFMFLVVIMDKEKCKEYFKSAQKQNEYQIWSDNFRFRKMNELLKEYEKTLSEDVQFISEWRNDLYSSYSGYVHNDFIKCFLKSFSKDKKKQYYYYNVWGMYNNEVKDNLESLNYLMWVVDLYFMHLVSQGKMFEKIRFKDENLKEMWNDSISLYYIIDTLYKRYVEENSRE